jgi:hypothetical protein
MPRCVPDHHSDETGTLERPVPPERRPTVMRARHGRGQPGNGAAVVLAAVRPPRPDRPHLADAAAEDARPAAAYPVRLAARSG